MKKQIWIATVAAMTLFAACEDKIETGQSSLTEEDLANEATLENLSQETEYEVDLFTSSKDNILGAAAEMSSKDHHRPFGGRYLYDICPNITIDSSMAVNGFPITVTLNYGDSVVLENGHVIRGIIQVVVYDDPRHPAAERDVTFIDFFIDDVQLTGDITKRRGQDPAILDFTSVADLTFTFPDGSFWKRDSENTRTFAEGSQTPFLHFDDVFHMDGFVNNTNSDGTSFAKTITQTLVKPAECRFIVQGTVTMTKNDEAPAILDFGNGECDDLATMTRNGETSEIRLRHHHDGGQEGGHGDDDGNGHDGQGGQHD